MNAPGTTTTQPRPVHVGDAVAFNGWQAFGVVVHVNEEKGICLVRTQAGEWVHFTNAVAVAVRDALVRHRVDS